MPLTRRQKRRLLEVSKMIESSIVVKDDMEEIQLEYAKEIDDVIGLISVGAENKQESTYADVQSSLPVSSRTESNVKRAREFRKRTKLNREARKHLAPSAPITPNAPDWAKKLWKSIAKKCHPDRLSFQELSAIQIARRQIWFLEARSLFEEQSWPKLIHIGVQVGEYVDDITHKEQLGWLNVEYEGISKNIQGMQNSLAWKWGTNWDNLDLRISIVTAVLAHRGLKVPPRQEITELLLKLEVD